MIWFKAKVAWLAMHVLVWSLSGHSCVMTMPHGIQNMWFDGYEKGCYDAIMKREMTTEAIDRASRVCHPIVEKTAKEFAGPVPDYCEVK